MFVNDLFGTDPLDENLKKWFKEKWVRFGPDGKIRGACARDDDSEGKPKCLPQSKAHALGKKGRASAASRKRREDPNPERSGKAINVATKKKNNEGRFDEPLTGWHIVSKAHGQVVRGTPSFETQDQAQKYLMTRMFANHHDFKVVHTAGVAEQQLDEKCWDTHRQVGMKKKGDRMVPDCVPKESVNEAQQCPECGGPMFSDLMLAEKKDACYNKVRSRYKVWPSAYASGALVQCRKKGAANWGNKSKNEARDWDEGNTEPANNFAITINGRQWKVFQGHGYYADDEREMKQYYKLKDWCRKKSEQTGKQWEVYRTGAPATESVSEGQLELNTPDPVVVVQDLKGNILDKVNLSVAAQKYKLGQPQNIKNQLAHQNYTTIGNYVIVSPMGGQPQDQTTQGVAEGKKPDRYHIVNKDGKPATLASYADRASAEKDRDAKHPGAEVRQLGPRGKVKGVSEGSDYDLDVRLMEMRLAGYQT